MSNYQIHLSLASKYGSEALAKLTARDEAALAAKDNGATYEEIGKAIGITKAGAQHLIRAVRSGRTWKPSALCGLGKRMPDVDTSQP